MTFSEKWKSAKTAFEKTTGAKKPSKTFVGLFNKGTGIDAALKKADAAKTAGDLDAAIKAFKTGYDDYVKVLDKAVKDPAVTPTADKAAYATAVARLKAELDAIHESAKQTAANLAGQQKKAGVDPAALKKAADQDIQKKKDDEAAEKKKNEARRKVLEGHVTKLVSCGAQIATATLLGVISQELKTADKILKDSGEKDCGQDAVQKAAADVAKLAAVIEKQPPADRDKLFKAAKASAKDAVMKASNALHEIGLKLKG